MRYIIMANGKGSRWDSRADFPKHLAIINGETLLERIVHQLLALEETDIVITSSNPAYSVHGALRHTPENNTLEIDRFTTELISDDCCFLYGDTYYSDEAMSTIVGLPVDEVMFVGSHKSIIAVIVRKQEPFLRAVSKVREAIRCAELADGKGWHVYSAYVGQPLTSREISKDFLMVNGTQNLNTVEDYHELLRAFSLNA